MKSKNYLFLVFISADLLCFSSSAYEYLGSSGEFIIYDDFNSADLNTDNWGTLAWNGGELPYTENNRVHFVGSQNPNSSLQGTLKSEYEHLGLPEMDNDSNSAIILKDAVLQNVHGIEFELLVSSSFQNDNTGLGFSCVEDFPYNYGFFMDAWRNSSNSKLQLEIGIYGNDILFGDSRFAYVGESEKAGYLSFTEIQYDTPYKIAYILKDDILYFYLDGIEIGQIEYDSSRVHTLALFRGTNEFADDYSGYIDDVRTYREFLDNDGDGLHNDDETNTGTYLSLRDTGTNPNDPDSDDDTLLDGAEIVTHLTNPNLSDSDSDGLSDSIEINLYSSNPNSSDSDNDGLSDLVEANLSSINFDINSNDSESVQTLKENGFLTVQDIHDIRLGSTMIEVSGNQATVQLQMQESSDLQTWEDTGTPATMTLPADTDTKFFRFKMAE